MKAFKVNEAVPYGDAGIFNALLKWGIIDDRKETAKIDVFFERFKGWEHYMVFYLWRSLSVRPGE